MSSYINKEKPTIKKQHITYLLLIVTLLIPKAGVTTSILPITVATLMYILVIALNFFNYLRLKISSNYIFIYTYLTFSSIITILLNIEALSAMNIAFMIVLLASPLTFLFSKKINCKKSNTIITYILILIGLYSILQFTIGVQKTSIEGITIAYGDDLNKKNIIRSGWIAKIPSTYANGTILAPTLIILISYVMEIKNKTKVHFIAIMFGLISLLLSGSRSSLFAAFCFLPFLCYHVIKNKSNKKTLYSLLLIFPISMLLLFVISKIFPSFINQIYNAYIGFTKNDPTLSGRTTQWSDFINCIKKLNVSGIISFIFIGLPWNYGDHLEGLPLILKLYGVFPFFTYLFFTLSNFIKFRRYIYISYALATLLLIFMVDGSVLYPPTLINLYLLLGIVSNSFNNSNVC